MDCADETWRFCPLILTFLSTDPDDFVHWFWLFCPLKNIQTWRFCPGILTILSTLVIFDLQLYFFVHETQTVLEWYRNISVRHDVFVYFLPILVSKSDFSVQILCHFCLKHLANPLFKLLLKNPHLTPQPQNSTPKQPFQKKFFKKHPKIWIFKKILSCSR